MTTINDAFVNAILADATYALEIDGMRNISGGQLAAFLSTRMTPDLAKYIGDNFTVVTHFESDDVLGSGFDATVWKRNSDNKYYISMQGTAGLEDFITDLTLTTTGSAGRQIYDMVNWWLKHTTPAGVQAPQIGLSGDIISSTAPVMGTGVLANIGSISVTGHSLGGHLATAFARLFGGSPLVIDDVTTFNSAGFTITSEVIFSAIEQLLPEGTSAGHFPSLDQQNNVYSANGFSATTREWLNINYGERIEVSNEESSNPMNNHFMYKITDLLALGNALCMLDPSLDLDGLNKLVYAGSNKTEASIESVLDAMRKMLNLYSGTPTPVGDVSSSASSRVAYYQFLTQMQESSIFESLKGHITITDATSVSATAARTNFGEFLCLYLGLPIAVSSSDAVAEVVLQGAHSGLYGQWNADKSLVNTERTFTDEYLQDRAQYLGIITDRNIADYSLMYANGNFTISDLARPDYWVGNTFVGEGIKIIFGTQLGDIAGLVGGTKADRFYGGGGSDFLTGNGGNDYLEGGTGSDTYIFNFTEEFGNDVVVDNAENSMAGGRLSVNGSTLSATIIRTTTSEGASEGLYQFVNADGTPQAGREYWSAALSGGALILFIADTTGLFQGTLTLKNYSATNNYGITLNDTAVAVSAAPRPSEFVVPTNGILATDPTLEVLESSRADRYAGHNSYNLDNNLIYNAATYYADDSTALIETHLFEGGEKSDVLKGAAWMQTLPMIIGDYPYLVVNTQVIGDLLSGYDGNDLIYGDGSSTAAVTKGDSDILIGGKGNDEIHGGGGDDYLYAWEEYQAWLVTNWRDFPEDYTQQVRASLSVSGSLIENANDKNYLYGDAGNDHIAGGSYNDTIEGGTGTDVIYGGAGQDVISGGDNDATANYEVLLGDSYAQSLLVAGNHYAFGLDLIAPVAGATLATAERDYYASALFNPTTNYNDSIDAGAGKDFIAGEIGADILLGGAGDDFIMGDRLNDTAWWTSSLGAGQRYTDLAVQFHGNDIITGSAGADTIFGNGGDDVIDGGTGADIIYGDDYVLDSRSDVWAYGNDIIDGGDGADTLVGGSGEDVIHGGKDNDVIRGGGKDKNGVSVVELNGNDWLYGDEGDDSVYGDGGDDYIEGGAGNDQLIGDYPAGPILLSNKGNDTLFGNAGNDKLWGDDGDDSLCGGTGDDVLNGGAGIDTYVFRVGDGNDIIESDKIGTNIISINTGSVSLNYVSNSYVNLHYGATDSITIDATTYRYMQILCGGVSVNLEITGTDTAGGFGDVIYGIAGGNNTIHAGAGNDYVHSYGNQDVVDGGTGNDRLTYYGVSDATLLGGDGNDDLSVMTGMAGTHTVMDGGDGDDTLYYRGGGATVLRGGAGDDNLTGGTGQDDFTGGDGADQFNFTPGFGSDTLHLTTGEGASDVIVFSLDEYGDARRNMHIERTDTDAMISFAGSADTLHIVGTVSDAPVILCTGSSGNVVSITTVDNKYAMPVDHILWQARSGEESDALPLAVAIADIHSGVIRVAPDANYIGGDAGDDIIVGMHQGVTLDGGAGDDSYLGGVSGYAVNFGAGYARDTIYSMSTNLDDTRSDPVDAASRYVNPNTVQIAAGITVDDMLFAREGDDLLLYLGLDTNAVDVLRVQNQFAVSWWGRPGVDYIDFADAPLASMDRDAMLQRVAVDMMAMASYPAASSADSFSTPAADSLTIEPLWGAAA